MVYLEITERLAKLTQMFSYSQVFYVFMKYTYLVNFIIILPLESDMFSKNRNCINPTLFLNNLCKINTRFST